MVFLLAGPATNASSLVVIARVFGRRFVAIYLGSVIVTALGMGYVLDLALDRLGITLRPPMSLAATESAGILETVCAVLLAALLLWSMARAREGCGVILGRMASPVNITSFSKITMIESGVCPGVWRNSRITSPSE